jgi:hypothetical protein
MDGTFSSSHFSRGSKSQRRRIEVGLHGRAYLLLEEERFEELDVRRIFSDIRHPLEADVCACSVHTCTRMLRANGWECYGTLTLVQPDRPAGLDPGVDVQLRLEHREAVVVDLLPIRNTVFGVLVHRAKFADLTHQ